MPECEVYAGCPALQDRLEQDWRGLKEERRAHVDAYASVGVIRCAAEKTEKSGEKR